MCLCYRNLRLFKVLNHDPGDTGSYVTSVLLVSLLSKNFSLSCQHLPSLYTHPASRREQDYGIDKNGGSL